MASVSAPTTRTVGAPARQVHSSLRCSAGGAWYRLSKITRALGEEHSSSKVGAMKYQEEAILFLMLIGSLGPSFKLGSLC